MNLSNLENFSHLLELSFSPVVLISGVGLLLLSMVNRFMQAINRTRQLINSVESVPESEQAATIEQIRILYKRSNIIKAAIFLVSCSIFSTGLLIVIISFMSFRGLDTQYLALGLYFVSIFTLLASVVVFLVDLSMSTRALRVEASRYLDLD